MRGRQRTQEEFINIVNDLYPDLKVISAFTTNNNRIKVLCQKCGTESNPLANALIQSTFNCQECSRIKKEKSFIERLFDINPNVNVIGKYNGNKTKINCLCLVHNKSFEMSPNNLLSGHGCPMCATEARIKLSTKSHDDFLRELKNISPTIEVNSPYVKACQKIQCSCSVCGFEWKVEPHMLLRGEGCPRCRRPSKGEAAISRTLDNSNIKYIQQHSFDDCVHIKPLLFDFYLPSYNACIEFQGRQHYEPTEYFGGEEDFKVRQKRDAIKAKYCFENDIELLCIPYWDYNNIEQIIIDFLTERRN